MSKRLFYLDLVRTIAVILIIITHYNAAFAFYSNPPLYDKCILTETPFNIYIGNLGVSLFLIISGCSLMYVYQDKCEILHFYKKRFLSIFPMFWLAYCVFFVIRIIMQGGFDQSIPKWKIILSVIGMDGYLSEYGNNFYILGEWFLGFIILFYLIFPILRWMMQKSEWITLGAIVILYAITLKNYNLQLHVSKCILVRLPELFFGMWFVKRGFQVSRITAGIAGVLLCVNTILKPDLHASIQTTYVGIAFFLVLVYISKWVEKDCVKRMCKVIGKYSYAIFLVHHVIITYMQAGRDLYALSDCRNYLLFTECCILIAVAAFALFICNDFLQKEGKRV
ncbi:MAG: acyltransferase [Lachnospiraceae bacterium]|nr:acyltransferase [Lachnospiraceae bacterium]